MRRRGTGSAPGSCDALDHRARGVEVEARLGAVTRVHEALGYRRAGPQVLQRLVELELRPDDEDVADVAGAARLLGGDQGLVKLLAGADANLRARDAGGNGLGERLDIG